MNQKLREARPKVLTDTKHIKNMTILTILGYFGPVFFKVRAPSQGISQLFFYNRTSPPVTGTAILKTAKTVL
jgi:hypothetical protein